MKNHYLFFILAAILLGTGIWGGLSWQSAASPQDTFTKLPKMQRIDKAIEQEFEATKDPALNEVPRQRLMAARAYASRIRSNPAQRGVIPGISWDERGPNNVSGRTRAILVDAGDATGNTLFTGGVGGGLWRTNNARAASPTWINIGDQFGNLAISALYQDPSNNNIMYFGTGEGWFNADAIRGLGIWKSTDGGTTWNQLSSTNNSTFHYVQKIVVDGSGNVYACTRDGGLQRSTNGGASWTKVLGSGAGASTNRAADIEIAANGDLYASMGIFSTDGIYKSTNGTSWTKLTSGLPSSGFSRIELACAPSDQNRVYAVYAGSNYDVSGIYRTDNGGSSWTSLTVPGAFGMTNYARGQAWYNLIAAVHPTNSSRVFIGGIDILVSDNAGSTWNQITQWYGGGGFQYAHADQHGMVFQPNDANVMYYSNDGGLYRTDNSGATVPTVNFISDGFNVTQFYHGDMHPGYAVNDYLMGAQDNGTQRFTAPGLNNTTEVTGGDGAFSHIDQDNPAIQISAYVYNQYRVTTNAWGSYTTVNYSSSSGRFINPTDYDSDQNVLYGANNGNSYFRMTNVGSGNNTGAQSMTAFGGAEASHVRVSPNVTNRVYFGLDNGDVVRVDNAHTTSATGTVIRAGSGYVSCVEIEPGNEDHILVTYSNYGVNSIFETTNGGSTWTSVEGNLPDMPIRWVIFVPGTSDSAMVATELGVWTTDNLNGSSTIWGASNNNFANVRVDALVSRPSDQQVIAVTHGRGMYSTDFFNIPPPPVTCNATVTSFPYNESFESGVGDWVLASGDFIWSRNSGGTPSSNTGPSGAADGSWYMYMEVSSPNYPNRNAYFEAPCFDLTGASDADVSFRYHMLGVPGTLRLEVSTDNGATWPTTLWTLSGDQGANWNTANVDLSAYAGSIIKLRFFGTSGSTWQGDICIDDFNMTTVSGGTPLAVSISSSTDVSCFAGSDGSATATATGGTAPYTYSWSSGGNAATETGLSAGTYVVTVTDAASAQATANVTLSQPAAALGGSINSNNVSCAGGNDGSIDLTVTGGTTPYSYSWSNGATSQDLSGLVANTYNVTITDANGCQTTAGVTISEPAALSAGTTSSDVSCAGGSDGSIDLTVSGGTTPFSYSWSNGATSQDLSGLVANTYNVTITDANGCQTTAGVTISEPAALSAGTTSSDVSCAGGSDGSIDLTVSGGTAPYSYSWSNGATSQDLSGLVANTYNVTLTDGNGCQTTAGVTISEPAALVLSFVVTDESGAGASDGAIDLTVSGGTPAYSFSWSNGETTEDLSGLAGGTYSVNVTDANGCVVSDSRAVGTLTGPLSVSITTSKDVSCFGGSDGFATASASGGTPPYSYSWSSGGNGATESGLPAGTYVVTVTDAASAQATANVILSQPSAALGSSISATNVSCAGDNDGSIDLTVTGGTAPYTYSWSTGATTQDLSGLAAGAYNVTITDANGCQTTDGATISEPAALSLSLQVTDESGAGASDGAIDLTVSGGTPAYSFNWSNGATTEDLSGLTGGSYSITVTDANGCQESTSGTVNTQVTVGLAAEFGLVNGVGDGWQSISLQNTYTSMVVVATPVLPNSTTNPVVTRVRNASGNSFELRIQVPGGTASTTYDVHYFVVEEGVYTQANDGITMEAVKANSTITAENNNWAFEPRSYQNSYSSPVVLGQVMTNNDPDWSVFWASANGNRVDPPSATSFAAGKNVGEDTDNTRANETIGYVVFESGAHTLAGINLQAAVGADIVQGPNASGYSYSLSGLSDASVAVVSAAAIDGGNGGWPVLFGSNPVSSTQLTMVYDEDQIGDSERTHTNEQVAYVVFENPTDPCAGFALNASATDISCFGAGDGTANATPVNGLAPFSYSWSTGATTAGLSGLAAGSYTVTVTDANNCTADATVNVAEPAVLGASAVATDANCAGENGSIDLTVTGGTTPYSYSWSDGSTSEDLSAPAGSYTVQVTDASGCIANAVGSISEPTALNTVAVATDANCAGSNDGSIDLEVTGGVAPYGYSWSNGASTQDLSGLAAGSYTVTVTDANGCIANDGASVSEPAPIVLSTSVTNESTPGANDGAIDLTVSGGLAPLSYAWTGPGGSLPNQEDQSSLAPGQYDVTVTDASGCFASTSATVDAASATPSISLEHGQLFGVTDSWQTVNLINTYTSMVVVATVNLGSTSDAPVVTRIRNASGSSFEIRLQNPGGGAVTAQDVYYIVVEEGTYDQATYGVKMEAVKVASTQTARKNGWGATESRTYQNSYSSPVVLGQVMTYNDAAWSSFWASNGSQTSPPSASAFAAGKHVGEDANTTRANETIGMLIFESGSGTIGSLEYAAGVGADIVRGTANSSSGYAYSISGVSNVEAAVVSAAGMDGGDGGWPVLTGANPITNTEIRISFDEDQLSDTERNHTTEQVAYFVIGAPATHNRPLDGELSEQSQDDPSAGMVLYPNPVKSKLHLSVQLSESQRLQLEIYDMKGKKVFAQAAEGAEGEQTLSLDVSELAVGGYLLRLQGKNLNAHRRFIRK